METNFKNSVDIFASDAIISSRPADFENSEISVARVIDTIFDQKNFETAYLELAEKFDITSKTARYKGIDGLQLNDIDFSSREIIQQAREELLSLSPLAPALHYAIPKKNNKETRDIYVFTIKDRIKAQAVYRVIEPIFEARYSPSLYSYRSTHPSFYAARSIARRYHRLYGKEYVALIDLENYTDTIDHSILFEKLRALGFTNEIIKLLRLFIETSSIRNGEIVKAERGILQGIPLTALFANLYLTELDEYIGSRAEFYRRIGDDFIFFDADYEKQKTLYEWCRAEIHRLSLVANTTKTKLILNSESFHFLGYLFRSNTVSLSPSSAERIYISWKERLAYIPKTHQQKIAHLKSLAYNGEKCFYYNFLQIVSQHLQINDDDQIKKLSENFFRLVVEYIYGCWSPRNQRLLKKMLPFQLPSLYKLYLDIHYGRKKISDFSLSREEKNTARN